MKRSFINCLVTTANIEVSMSFSQWRAYENGEMNLAEIKMVNDVKLELSKFNIDYYKLAIFIGAIMLNFMSANFIIPAYAASGAEAIHVLGNKFLNIIQNGMYFVCLSKGILEVGKEVTKGGDNLGKIGRIIITYIVAFSTIYLLPWAFDTVRDTFQSM